MLSSKHAKDIIVPECKNGETWSTRQLLKLDAWVLRRTYSPLTTIGYEIKINRQDFERDQKWIAYTDLCHEFYFVCPAGLIRAIDLPKGIGLIWTTMSGQALQTKIKAERHQPDLEKFNALMIYVIMSRSVIVNDMHEANKGEVENDRLKVLREQAAYAESRKELAHFVNEHVRKRFDEMSQRCIKAEHGEERVKDFECRLASLGITWDSKSEYWLHNQEVRNEIELLGNRIDEDTLRSMKILSTKLQEVVSEIETQRKKAIK